MSSLGWKKTEHVGVHILYDLYGSSAIGFKRMKHLRLQLWATLNQPRSWHRRSTKPNCTKTYDENCGEELWVCFTPFQDFTIEIYRIYVSTCFNLFQLSLNDLNDFDFSGNKVPQRQKGRVPAAKTASFGHQASMPVLFRHVNFTCVRSLGKDNL